jgi:D-alanyl-D-alanine carboxypeptidase
MYAELGSEVALSDLIQGVIIQSANDGAIAIAEGLAGSEERFAADMTARARELGLTVSTFKNATGLPAEGHVSSVRELARLTRYLIEVFRITTSIMANPNLPGTRSCSATAIRCWEIIPVQMASRRVTYAKPVMD